MTLVALLVLALAAGPDDLRARLEEARVLIAGGSSAEGLKLLQLLLPEAEAAGDQKLVMNARYQACRGHFLLAEYPVAMADCRSALELSRARKDRAVEAEVLRFTGQIHKTLGAYAEGIRASEQALAIFEEVGDRMGAAKAWVGVGACRDLMGEHRRALEAYERARPALEGSGDRWADIFLNEVAITYLKLGRMEDALATYRRALESNRRRGNKYDQQTVLNNMGELYLLLGQPDRAIAQYQEGLALAREIDERRGIAFHLGGLALAWSEKGDWGRAAQHARQQLQVAREAGLRHLEGEALANLGQMTAAHGDLEQGGLYFEQALAILRELGQRTSIAVLTAALADIRARQGRSAEARRLAEEAMALARASEVPEIEWTADLALARAARAEGRRDEAVAALKAGIDVIDSMRARVLTDAGKIGYLDARQAVHHELVDVLTEQGQHGAALEAAEAARGRAFLDLLAGPSAGFKPARSAALVEIRDLEARLRAKAQASPATDTARAELTATRAAMEQDLEARIRRLRGEDPELASLVLAQPPKLDEIRAAARERQATILEYLLTERRLFAWVVDPGGEVRSAVVPVGRDELRQRVGKLLERLGSVDLAELSDPGPARAALAELHRLVLAPVASHLPSDPTSLVYVVPHDALSLLPFPGLVDERGRYAVETHTFVSVPAVGVLRYTAGKKERAVSPARPHLLALADPTPPAGAGVHALPGARAEVRRIGLRFPPSRRTTLLGASASEANAKRLGPGQTLLHFAVHGLIDDTRPWQSMLVLSPGDGEDGLLRLGEVFALDLQADLVVLSGCSTGRGKLSGDGILGLARAFLYAGTPSVVVSQWDVSDVTTALLMDRLYAGLRARGNKAQALRQAQLQTLRRYPHPALWAAFVLVGEGS